MRHDIGWRQLKEEAEQARRRRTVLMLAVLVTAFIIAGAIDYADCIREGLCR